MHLNLKGINHIGLVVEDIEKAKVWFRDVLGCKIFEDRGELVFFFVGQDILAIKTPRMAVSKPEHGMESKELHPSGFQALDHYGFFANSAAEVDEFASWIQKNGATIIKGPYDRRDGRSVYFRDPLGLVGEFLYFSKNS